MKRNLALLAALLLLMLAAGCGGSVQSDTVADPAALTESADRLGDHASYASGNPGGITLHEMLSQTAGLPEAPGDEYGSIGRRQVVDLSTRAVGARAIHNYSSTGYSMLGAVIEEVTDMSYAEYLRSVYFESEGMTDTGSSLFLDDDLTMIVATNTGGADDGVAYRISHALLGTTLAES